MQGIHETKLIQQIRKAAKTKLIWQRTEGAEYIAASPWLVKLVNTAGTKIRAALFEAFGREALVGQSLTVVSGTVSENGPDCGKIYQAGKATQDGYLTPIIIVAQEKGEQSMRLVVIDMYVLAINSELAEMVAEKTAAGTGPNEPVYFGPDKELLILPFRSANDWRRKLESHLPVERGQ